MENELIRRSDTVRAIEEAVLAREEWISDCRAERNGLMTAIVIVDSIPAVDAVEVRHGRWVVASTDHAFSDGTKARWNIWKCSRCPYVRTAGWEYTTEGQKPKARYCENCGTRMDGEEEYNAIG